MVTGNTLLKLGVVLVLLLGFSSAVSAADSSGRVVPEIDYRYSSLVLDLNSSRGITFNVRNPSSQVKEFESTVSGSSGFSFSATGSSSTGSYTLESGETESFMISVNPVSTGSKQLVVNTQNLETGLNTTVSMPVMVREYPAVASTASEVPGIGSIQLIMLLLVSACLYFVRL